ncbi:MAG: DUF58 domain-containing protein [Capsulimonadaceae bacterium]|nr:DUF58 domain-containing protein [Capsulimonadaceae bacterium]
MLIDSRIKKLAIGTASLFLLIVAVLLNAQQMYLMAIVVALITPVSWALGYLFASGLQCERVMPLTSSVHERVKVRLRVANPTMYPRFFLRFADRLPRWLRFAGGDTPQGPLILNLSPGREEDLVYYFEPLKRGMYRIGPLRVISSDPLGFWMYRKGILSYSELIVYPQILAVRPEFLDAGGGRGWQDQDSAQSRGSGIDFDGVREYRSGDELRRVNWKATARTGTLAVTEYTQGYANAMVIVLDTNHAAYHDSGAGIDSALEYGVTLAASITSAALRYGSPVSLLTSDDLSMADSPLRGVEQLAGALDMLARAEATSDQPFSDVLDRAQRLVRPGTLLVTITPEPSTDERLRGALNEWLRAPAAASLTMFWLEKDAFHRVHQGHVRDVLARKRRASEADQEPLPITRSVQSKYGREFHVAPDGEISRILQGYSNG